MRLAGWLLVGAMGSWACGPTAVDDDDGGPGSDGGGSCDEGARTCQRLDRRVCQGGSWQTLETCNGGCVSGACTTCQPGTGTCSGRSAQQCLPDGSGYVDFDCDPALGLACDVDTGRCEGACAPDRLGQSYIGCEYYPTVTASTVHNAFDFAVTVSNAGDETATVTITGGALSADVRFDVAPGSIAVQRLPWQEALKICNEHRASRYECAKPVANLSQQVVDGAYRLRSTQPVTVYQLSPLDYRLEGSNRYSFANDASLLLPVTALRGTYLINGWPAWQTPVSSIRFPALVAVTAIHDGTTVTVDAAAHFGHTAAAPALTPGDTALYQLDRGDVLQLVSMQGDPTGTRIDASAPVQVLSAHTCTEIPFGRQACDHIEEAMLPIDALGASYLVSPPITPESASGRPQFVRIAATEPATSLTFDPPLPGVPTQLAAAGDHVAIPMNSATFQVTASKKVSVAQYMIGQGEDFDESGDPAMTQAVPTEQFRTEYLIHAPLSYANNYLTVFAPTGAQVLLDGAALSGFAPIGNSGFSVTHATLASTSGGNHQLSGDQPFGVQVYGYGKFTSYWYPGGLDLRPVIVE